MNKLVTKAAAIVGLSVVLGLLFDYFFFEKVPGISFPVYIILVAAGIAALSRVLRQRLQASAWWLAVPLIGFAAMVAIRANEFLAFLNVVACLSLLLVIAQTAFRRRLTDLRIGEYLRIPFLPLRFLAPAGLTVRSVLTSPKAYRDRPLLRQVVKGIALTLPILVIFLLLFASADLVIQRYLTGIFSFRIDEELVPRLMLMAFVSFGFIGAYSYLFGRTEPEPAPDDGPRKPILGKVESMIMFGSVNALFFGFILVQLTYLFGGQAIISDQVFTYAEYARKGFFELLAVGIVAFVLLWLAEKYVEVKEKGHSLLFKVLSSVLIAQVIIVMASAFRRLQLYEEAYGFTAQRLYSHAFTILLAAVFLILAYKIIRSASDKAFAFPTFLAVIAFVAVMNLMNPDAFIARQNFARYDETGKIDANYLTSLSDDAVPVILDNYDSLPQEDQEILEKELEMRRMAADSQPYWQSWNLSRQRADELLN